MQTKTIGSVSYHTDSEYASIQIGDASAGWDDIELKDYLKRFGDRGLRELQASIAWMNYNLIKTWQEIEAKRGEALALTLKDQTEE